MVPLFLSVALVVLATSLIRLLWILPSFRIQPHPTGKSSANIVIVLGSGGHTAEMLRLLEALNFNKYPRRIYVVSGGDKLSEGKARAFETRRGGSEDVRSSNSWCLIQVVCHSTCSQS
jgi:beta-1,4-N-acetylglucosaminyltransferase